MESKSLLTKIQTSSRISVLFLIFTNKIFSTFSQYHDYRVVPFDYSIQQFIDYIQSKLFSSSNLAVSRLTVSWVGSNDSNLIRIVEDKDVSWLMLVLSKFTKKDLFIIVDTTMSNTSGKIVYLNFGLAEIEHFIG